jgi:N-carbamoyl-L-amino-acid hydrolase
VTEAPARHAAPPPDIALAERLFAELAARTAARRGVTRASYGPGEQVAHDILAREGAALGLAVATDAARNLYLTLPGTGAGPGLIVGSHLDSVPLGGNYDGAAGVLMGLAVAAGLRAAGQAPPRDLTVMAIRAEESTWFAASYIGSRAAFGRLAAGELDGVCRAGDGMALGQAVAAAGGDPAALARGEARLDPARIAAFVEPHIEQGPVLEDRGLPVGIVTGIRGAFRHRAALCLGAYAHSGATPRAGRRDALRAVARLVVAMDAMWERRAAAGEDLTVTFGEIATDPDEAAFSKVAGRVAFTLDVRSDSDMTLAAVRGELAGLASAIAAAEGVRLDLGPETGTAPAAMDPGVTAALAAAAAAAGVPALAMPCGAGHDAAVFSQMGVPTGMLFVRNAHGSHNPDEAMAMADFAAAARVLAGFCLSPPCPR